MPHHSPVHSFCFPLFSILLMYYWGLLSLLAPREKRFWLLFMSISLQCSHHCFLFSLVLLVVPLLDLLSCFPLLIASKSSFLFCQLLYFCWSWTRFIYVAFCSMTCCMCSFYSLASCVVFILMASRYMLSSVLVIYSCFHLNALSCKCSIFGQYMPPQRKPGIWPKFCLCLAIPPMPSLFLLKASLSHTSGPLCGS